VAATDALLDTLWVPRQVVVDDDRAELKVDALRGGLGGDHVGLELGPIDAVHDAYFSQDAKGRAKDSRGEGELDRSIYEKIMRGKEQLLSAGEPLRFIFTHSALREGWDNPQAPWAGLPVTELVVLLALVLAVAGFLLRSGAAR
jgi:hypothetical protein